MAIQIGAKPDSGFDDPIGMLTDCHRSILRFVDVFAQVAQRSNGKMLEPDERAAVDAALRYFRESGPRHNQDEEESLFPRLQRLQGNAPADESASAEIGRLTADHELAATLHAEVEQLYARWMRDGSLPAAEAAQLEAVSKKLAHLYRDHIRVEEEIVFPEAAKLLDRGDLAAMGAEFKARRS